MSNTSNYDVTIDSEKLSLEDIWNRRTQWTDDNLASTKLWEAFTTEYREALRSMVLRSIESFHQNVDQWLPEALIDGKGGDYIEFRTAIMFTEIDSQVSNMQSATDFEIERTKASLASMLGVSRENETIDDVKRRVRGAIKNDEYILPSDGLRLIQELEQLTA